MRWEKMSDSGKLKKKLTARILKCKIELKKKNQNENKKSK